MVSPDFPLTRRALALLNELGFSINDENYVEQTRQYYGLCSTWNLSAKLLSTKDISQRFDDHVADSLSLSPYVNTMNDSRQATLVDVGTGAGFPAIPLCLACPNLKVLLVERSETKATFLRQAIKRFGAEGASVQVGNYPHIALPSNARVYTARAIEDPDVVDQEIIKQLQPGDLYLAQRDVKQATENRPVTVEEVDDGFQRTGLRRGKLYRVSR